MTREPDVSVVICAFSEERWESLRVAVESAGSQTWPPGQIIVVIDHNDSLLGRARGAFGPDVLVTTNTGPHGLAGARNTGLSLAMGDVVAFLDDDAEAEPGWLESLVGPYDIPTVAGTGAYVMPMWPGGRRPRWFPPEFDWVVGCSYRGLPEVVARVRNPIGAAMSFRRSLFDEVGGFDTDMGRRLGARPLGCEETELAVRAQATNHQIEFVHVPQARVRHLVSADRTRFRYFVRRCYAEGLSKAALAQRAGPSPALASERHYASSTLPRGVLGGVTDGLRGDVAGLARAATIATGLVVTSVAYVLGRLAGRLNPGGRRAVASGADERRNLLGTFGFLVGQQGSTLVLGLAFWVFVAHLFAPVQVGTAFAASNVGLLLGTVGVLGIPMLLLSGFRAVSASRRRVALSTALAVSGLAVGALAILLLGLAPAFGQAIGSLASDPAVALGFVVGSALTAAASAFDNAAVAIRRGRVQLVRGLLASVFKFAAVGVLIGIGVRSGAGLVLAWAGGLGVSLAVCYPMLGLARPARAASTVEARMRLVRAHGRTSLRHHVLTLSIVSVGFLVPVVAATVMTTGQYAYFATANTIASVILVIPWLMALSLFAEASQDEFRLQRLVRHTLPLGMMLSLGAVAVVEVGAPVALRLFGSGYALHGIVALRLLVLVGPAYVVKDHFVAIARARGRLARASTVMVFGTAIELLGAALGGLWHGVNGLCLFWAVATWVEAAALAPSVLRVASRAPRLGPVHPEVPPMELRQTVGNVVGGR